MIDWINTTDEPPPKDGTEFLIWTIKGAYVVYDIIGKSWKTKSGHYIHINSITHWAKITPPEL